MTNHPEHDPQTHRPQIGVRRLTRNTDDALLGGVCAGVADYFGLDANLVRLITGVGLILSAGTVLLVYIAAWLLLPED